ncbi:MAG: 3-methyl-2-oxobutanoate hydroxymethyltransferase [Bacteroidetes bacterium]|nr:MAG: 3-methyl-2-oxobutanoate hydroxymethyltransferase [Bacteroidota bacterium]
MRAVTIIIILLFTNITMAQNSEELEVKNTIIKFFDAFHKQDSIAIMAVVSEDIVLQSIGKNKEGVTQFKKEKFNDFLKSIVSIPKDQKFEEKILDFKIRVDGPMANAWTPYEFWFNDKFSHCGVNSFQLIKLEGTWKIIYLIDTRRREGCE